jgi:diguanylate cyclase (GGDEF)-like protein
MKKALSMSSLRLQILFAFGVVSGGMLIVAALISGLTHWLALQETQRTEAHAMARVLAENLSAAMVFQDKQAAGAILHSLSARDDVVCAVAIDHFGQPFAHYPANTASCLGTENGAGFQSGQLKTVVPVGAGGERVGSLLIQMNQKQVVAEMKRIAAILSGVLVAILLVSYPFSQRLARRIAGPIHDLARLMGHVAERGEYAARASEAGSEEVVLLGHAFNQMLRQIESREQSLQDYQHSLEAKIAERTAELRAKQAELETLAHTDGLTGLYNRRYFMELLNLEFQRSVRQNHTLSVLMLDLDHFKRVNDCHGHQAGDLALASAARILRNGVRGSDLVGRFGGEEFAIALPETGHAEAMELSERLCQDIRAWVGDLDQGKVLKITCSIGVATWRPDTARPLDSVIRQADDALYMAKEQGRDRVVRHES